jgi:hypothetical protein
VILRVAIILVLVLTDHWRVLVVPPTMATRGVVNSAEEPFRFLIKRLRPLAEFIGISDGLWGGKIWTQRRLPLLLAPSGMVLGR